MTYMLNFFSSIPQTSLLLLSCVFCFSLFILSFISNRKHLLATLLTLEGLMLMIFCLLALISNNWGLFYPFILVFLAMVACEGALGLSLLVSAVRTHGSDHFSSMNSLQC